MPKLHESWEAIAHTLSYKNEAEMLIDLYKVKTWSISQISKKLGYAQNAVRERLLLLGIKLRGRGGPNALGHTRLGHLTDEVLKKLKHGDVIKDKNNFDFQVNHATIYHEKKRRELCISPQSVPQPILTDTQADLTSKCVLDAGQLSTQSIMSGIEKDENKETFSSSTTEPTKESC